MSQVVELMRVFLASPGDVMLERKVVEGVIEEMSPSWTSDHGYKVELVRAETHAYPGFGDDAQDVINKQIGDDCDVFIGIMWTRVGTETDRSESGTVEEFERAYARFKADSSSVHLMMYFKNGPVQPSEVDTHQLEKVKQFKQRVSDLGGYYAEFLHVEDFERLIRSNLSQLLRDKRRKSGPFDRKAVPGLAEQSPDGEPPAKATSDEPAADRGYLDLIEEAEAAFERLNGVVTCIIEAQDELGSRTSTRTSEMEAAAKLPAVQQRQAFKKAAKNSAGDMDEYVDRVEPHLPVFTESLRSALDCFAKAAELTADFTEDDTARLKEARDSAEGMQRSMATAHESLQGFRESVAGLPRLTTALNRAKRRVVDVTDTLLREMSNGEHLAGGVVNDITRLIDDLEDDNES